MSKYIDADKVKNGIMKFVNEYGEIVGMFVNDFNILLERCAVDVDEVKHGRWKRLIKEPPVYACTECGRTISTYNIDRYPYCHCGAKMEGEQNG